MNLTDDQIAVIRRAVSSVMIPNARDKHYYASMINDISHLSFSPLLGCIAVMAILNKLLEYKVKNQSEAEKEQFLGIVVQAFEKGTKFSLYMTIGLLGVCGASYFISDYLEKRYHNNIHLAEGFSDLIRSIR